MYLAGQERPAHNGAPGDDSGYAMAALLVGLGVMAVMLTVAMPVWKQTAQREKEAELVFRGQQYARAIGLFQRRAGPGVLPPNLDVLIQQRFLRKKYKDPITGDDFQLLLAGQAVPGQGGGPTAPGAPGARGTGGNNAGGTGASTSRGNAPGGPLAQPGQVPGGVGAPTGAVGGIQGVVSKSKARSIRLFNGRTTYNEWTFVYVPQVQAPGGAPGAPGTPGGNRGRGPQPPSGPGGFNSNPPGAGGPGSPVNPRGTTPPGGAEPRRPLGAPPPDLPRPLPPGN